VLKDVGQRGHYTFNESYTQPGARCSYTDFVNLSSWFKSMRVSPPRVFAPDRDSSKIDSMRVGWRVVLQKSTNGATWTRIARSALQKATAYENSPAPFSAVTLSYTGPRDQARFRAVVVINWYSASGTRIGQVKLTPDYASTKIGSNPAFYGLMPCRNPVLFE
jgi:hypothetical protein